MVTGGHYLLCSGPSAYYSLLLAGPRVKLDLLYKSNIRWLPLHKLRFRFFFVIVLWELQSFFLFFFSTYFVWQDFLQSLSTQASGLQLLSGLLCSLTLHQSFCLSQEVSQQDLQPHQTHTPSDTEQHSVCYPVSLVSHLCLCCTPICRRAKTHFL